MVCSISCSLSLVFIISMIYMHNAASQSQVVQLYQKQLPSSLQAIYKKIVEERLRIYYFGYILGFILSAIIIFYNYSTLATKGKNKFSTASTICIVIAVSFITNYFYYILSPKTNWMLDNITTQEQNKAWLQMYREMQYNYHMGLVLGIIAVGIFAFAFRC